MKKYISLIWVPLIVLASQQSSAGSMMCGAFMIDDEQTTGQSRSDIEVKCGTPESSYDGDLYYKKDNMTYRLHFNDSDELESITVEVD